eukprot:TRINITY_DN12227_c0_g1_i2.p1 TRINITY_DN12227_c0_g1~~TRINITY_DN12227_c0_g1_i2.p1  ORF type:complete len:431 (-),score=77.03 TRINITY_DN12227_c0_g1_i2:270-1562(-)
MILSAQRQLCTAAGRCGATNLRLSSRGLCASTDAGLQNRRLWRWGAVQGGIAGKLSAPELSKEPQLQEDFQGVSSTACGSNHSAFVISGKLYTYGANKYDQLGRASSSSDACDAPAPVEIDTDITQVALGAFHSAAVTADGGLFTWGWGGSFFHGAGALGHGSRTSISSPAYVQQLEDMGLKVKQVACGNQHTLVLTEDGLLFATGKGDFGRLGRGDTSDELEFQEIDYFQQTDDSILVPGEQAEICKIGAGSNFSAALSKQGELWVWGRNDYGQLGLGEEAMGDMYSAERFPRLVRSLAADGHKIVDFCCGEHHLLVLTSEGALFEWGNRTWLEPHRVAPPSIGEEDFFKSIVKVSAGDKFNFVLTDSGRLYTWGSKSSSCLALGESIPKNVVEPTLVPASVFNHQRVTDITASKNRCLAVTDEAASVA